MSYLRALSIVAFGLALPVTIALKLQDVGALNQAVSAKLKEVTASLLTREGFAVETSFLFGFVIDGQRGDCHLQVREASVGGFNADIIKMQTPKDARLAFEFDGKLWSDHPTARAIGHKIWNRLKWHFRIDDIWAPILSIYATGPCPIDTMPWHELARIRAR